MGQLRCSIVSASLSGPGIETLGCLPVGPKPKCHRHKSCLGVYESVLIGRSLAGLMQRGSPVQNKMLMAGGLI